MSNNIIQHYRWPWAEPIRSAVWVSKSIELTIILWGENLNVWIVQAVSCKCRCSNDCGRGGCGGGCDGRIIMWTCKLDFKWVLYTQASWGLPTNIQRAIGGEENSLAMICIPGTMVIGAVVHVMGCRDRSGRGLWLYHYARMHVL